MIDLSTISSMELIQNLQNPKSKDCLFGLLNQTLTPMGSRLLKSLLLQPSTNAETLEKRFDALDELATREDIFFAVRQGTLATGLDGLVPSAKTTAALKAFLDVDRVLTAVGGPKGGQLCANPTDYHHSYETYHSVLGTIH